VPGSHHNVYGAGVSLTFGQAFLSIDVLRFISWCIKARLYIEVVQLLGYEAKQLGFAVPPEGCYGDAQPLSGLAAAAFQQLSQRAGCSAKQNHGGFAIFIGFNLSDHLLEHHDQGSGSVLRLGIRAEP
jgi:hypothetical protein